MPRKPKQEEFRATITAIVGDEDFFADLVGKSGKLSILVNKILFIPDGGFDRVAFTKTKRYDNDGHIKICTTSRNAVTFKIEEIR